MERYNKDDWKSIAHALETDAEAAIDFMVGQQTLSSDMRSEFWFCVSMELEACIEGGQEDYDECGEMGALAEVAVGHLAVLGLSMLTAPPKVRERLMPACEAYFKTVAPDELMKH